MALSVHLRSYVCDFIFLGGLYMSEGLDLCSSAKMQPIRDLIAKVAATNTTLLLRGESGVGKEVVARAIHKASPRAHRQFLKVNCAALPGELLESELFGHEKGAFTGAYRQKPGKFEAADQGTLLLDEIGEMPLRLQAKLLHVLQDGEFSRVGGEKIIGTDVRLIASTNRDLETAMRAHQFREDLYYRLNVIEIRIPPLRERREEIPVLVDHFLTQFNSQSGRKIDIPRQAARDAERVAIKEVLDRVHWNRAKAARLLQISYKALLYKIVQCGLVTPEEKQGIVPEPMSRNEVVAS